MKSVSAAQLRPRLRALLGERRVPAIADHSFKGTSTVDLFIGCRPPIVVHVCERPTIAEVEPLLRHRQHPRERYAQWTEYPEVHAIFREEPTARTREGLEARGVAYTVLAGERIAMDALAATADAVAARYRELISESQRRQSTSRRTRASGGGSISVPKPGPLTSIAGPLDSLKRQVKDFGEDAAEATTEDFELAEAVFSDEHYPACVLHLARGTEALVLCLADRWDARPDRHVLREIDELRAALDQFGERLAELRGAERETVRTQLAGKARKQGTDLVDRIVGLLLDGGTARDASGEDLRTILSALGDIERRHRRLPVVRETLKGLRADASFQAMIALRNTIAHARAGGQDFDAPCVQRYLAGMLTLLRALETIRDAIEGWEPSVVTVRGVSRST